MAKTTRIEGLKELSAQINTIITSLGPDEVEPVLLEGAEMIADRVRQKAPRGKTGRLAKSVIAKKLKRLQWNRPAPCIAAVDQHPIIGAPHAHLVEWGHGGPHPAPAHPFFRPAVDEMANPAAQYVMNRLAEKVNKAAGG